MHDLKYANEILAALNKAAVKKNKACAIVVNVRLNPFSHVTAEGLDATFRLLAESEGYGDIRLNVRTLEFILRCKSCRKVSRHGEPIFKCPDCGSPDFDIEKGDDFCIDSIDVNKK
ncbi:MAG: hydrogenase maturation nickel metallochaperone HypA [Candidatus Omnitrophica bacterium]|jgi:Zn finger protein HypA/HybF involved in hydrogenase expression|nr:hydrogenase maturation nickel metallochaperone HypA [Candidatus Omnitrophota bacterium]